MFCRWLPSAERLESFNSAAAWRSGVWRSICKAKQEPITADKSRNLWFDFVSIKVIGKHWHKVMVLMDNNYFVGVKTCSLTWECEWLTMTGWWCAASSPPEYLQGINVSPRAQIVPWFAHFNILQQWVLVTGIYNIADMGSPSGARCLCHAQTFVYWKSLGLI